MSMKWLDRIRARIDWGRRRVLAMGSAISMGVIVVLVGGKTWAATYPVNWSYVQIFGHNVSYSPVQWFANGMSGCGVGPIALREGGQNYSTLAGRGWIHINYNHFHSWSQDPLIWSSLMSFNSLMYQGLTAPNVVGQPDPGQPGFTVYYLKYVNDQSLSTLNQFVIVKVVAQMNNNWGIYTAFPTSAKNTTIPKWSNKSQFPDWMGNYAEFAGQVSGPQG
ncbi:MAG: hypothetical protein C7B47_15545 [Sulfobacillus thermosulfidooxidans]|uniref:Uncharacterized protein n=1 Tax=Sulfobacillus thermosulfidooxidans TaxID=28034 RepID=A0A2T2WP51_SULTH|nr:MAG: hypothetical protein C7B47_15545 [Sulfobacillus thermosulfidooxidans]